MTRRFVVLAALVFLAYSPAVRGTFLWDDLSHVPDRTSLYTLAGLRQIWTLPGYVQQYYPLTFSTVWAAHHAWGSNPMGFHLLTLLFHALNAVCMGWLLSELEIPGAWWAAAIFGLHPVHVESVAWISEIKNTQSAFFYLIALICYWRFLNASTSREAAGREDSRWIPYVLAFAAYLCALFSKTVSCTMPVVALILLWHKRGRLVWKELLPLSPFLAAGVVLGGFTAHWEKTLIGAMGPSWNFSLGQRVLIAGRAFWFYIGKLVWPHPLAFIYPRWNLSRLWLTGGLSLIALACFFGWLLAMTRRFGRGPLAAVLAYAVMVAPALGFVNIYPMRYTFAADHYQYLASIPLIACLAACLMRLLSSVRVGPTRSERYVMATLCLVLGHLTWSRAHAFQNSFALWKDTVTKNPDCMMAHANLGVEYMKKGAAAEARAEAAEAIRLMEPDNINVLLFLGDLRLRVDHNPDAALDTFQQAYEASQRLPPSYTAQVMLMTTHLSLGRAYFDAHRNPQAKKEYQEALQFAQGLRARPLYNACPEVLDAIEAEIHQRLGQIALAQGEIAPAIDELRLAVQVGRQNPELWFDLATTFEKAGKRVDAIEAYRQVHRLDPHSWEANNALGLLLERQGQWEEAIQHDREAIELNPDLTNTRFRLGRLLLKMNRKPEALAEYRAALQTRAR